MFAGDVAIESFHGFRTCLDALILSFDRIVVMFEPMFSACYWYAVNQFHACMVEVFVEGASRALSLYGRPHALTLGEKTGRRVHQFGEG